MAITAPLPEDGKKGWQESPAWMTRPRGECHTGCGSRHMSLQSMHSSLVVDLINARMCSAQPSSAGTYFSALEALVVSDHDSREVLSVSLWVSSQHMVFLASFLPMTICTSGPMTILTYSGLFPQKDLTTGFARAS